MGRKDRKDRNNLLNTLRDIPLDILYEIVKYVDYKTFIKISKVIPLDDSIRWSFLLAQVYPRLYHNLKQIGEDHEDHPSILYYYYKDNMYNFRILYHKPLYEYSHITELDKIYDSKLNLNPFLLRLVLHANFPGVYHRVIKLIKVPVYIITRKMVISDIRTILYSLIYACNKNRIYMDYLTTGNNTGLDIKQLQSSKNYVFTWLYCTDPNVDINSIEDLNDAMWTLSVIAKSDQSPQNWYQNINSIIDGLSDNNIDTVYHYYFGKDKKPIWVEKGDIIRILSSISGTLYLNY